MISFKRKRRKPSDSELWDEFSIQLKETISKNDKFSTISRVDLMLMKAMFTVSIGSRVYINEIIDLFSECYNTKAWIELRHSKTSGAYTEMVIHVQCSNVDGSVTKKGKILNSMSPLTLTGNGDVPTNIALKEKLYFTNKAVLDQLNQIIQKVRHHYVGEMDWEHDNVLEVIYHKKHKHVILRFKLNSTSPKLIEINTPTRICNPWMEYNKEEDTFWLITVLQEAV